MSYNIDSIAIVASDGFRVSKAALRRVFSELDGDVPEVNLFDQADEDTEDEDEFWVPTHGLWWYGEGSGGTERALVERVLPLFEGSADLVLTWEGGDSHSGLRLRNGVVAKHHVVMSLGEEK